MRKLVVVLGLAVGLGLLVGPAVAADNDVNGPKCADINGGDWGYRTAPSGDRVLVVKAFLPAVACKQIDYTMVVNGGTPVAPTETCSVEGAVGCLQWTINFGPTGPDVACFSVTTSVGNHVFDVAPDVDIGCQAVSIENSGGQSGFN